MYQKIIHRRYRKRRFFYLFFILVILLTTSWYLYLKRFDFFYHDKEFDELIQQTAKRHTIDPCLIKAVIWKESRFKKNARGSKGEIGLMQIMNGAVKDWSRENHMPVPCKGVLYEPEINIEIGTWYLARALKHWKNKGYTDFEKLALCEYNAGRRNTKTWLPAHKTGSLDGRIKFASTQAYVDTIMEKYFEYTAKREAQ